MFKSPFTFDGRIRRAEFGISMIIYFVTYMTALFVMESLGTAGAIIGIILIVAIIWFMIAQSAKRCHDVGRSGWWQLIPFYGFVLLFQGGDPGRNEYGQNPKEPEGLDVLESETLDGHLRN